MGSEKKETVVKAPHGVRGGLKPLWDMGIRGF